MVCAVGKKNNEAGIGLWLWRGEDYIFKSVRGGFTETVTIKERPSHGEGEDPAASKGGVIQTEGRAPRQHGASSV